jgi:transcriptional regulator GlxA family with amidase domain
MHPWRLPDAPAHPSRQRILLAQQLLEETGETVDAVAERAGFGNATALRHHFRTWKHTTPHAYRRAFRLAGAA